MDATPEQPPATPPGVYDLFGCSQSASDTSSSSRSSGTASGSSLDSLAPPTLAKASDAAPPLAEAAKEDEPRKERALTAGRTLATASSGLSGLLQEQLQVAQVVDAVPQPTPESPGNYELFPMAPPADSVQETASSDFALFPSASGGGRELDSAAASGLPPPEMQAPPSMAMTTTNPGMMQPPAPAYKMSGNAVDIIAVRNMENQFLTTSWHVCWRRNGSASGHYTDDLSRRRSCSTGRASDRTLPLASEIWFASW